MQYLESGIIFMETENKQTDLQTKEQNRQMALLKISENALSLAIAEARYDEAHALLPTNFKQVLEQPKVREQIMAIGEESVLRQIEFELIQLSLLVSVGGNLTKQAVPFIARQLVEMYPNESIADFRLCFERGAMARYGSIQRLDGVTIGEWMKGYLDEKYTEHENILIKEKKAIIESESKGEILTDESKISAYLKEIADRATESKIQNVMTLTDKEIRKFGKNKPVTGNQYKPMSESEHEAWELHRQWIRDNHDLRTGYKLPTWISEEEWLKKLNKI